MTISLITGATRGIGLATARALAMNGDRVLVTGRNLDAAEQAAEKLRGEGLDAHGVELDVTSSSSIQAAVQHIEQGLGALDVLVNNAGILPEATDATEREFANPEIFKTTFETNLFGAVAVIEAFLPLLRGSAAGRIVNVSTTMGSLADQANPDSPYYQMVVPAYQASKAALNSVTIGLAKTLADTDIKVTSVCPGFVQTDLTPVNKDQAPTTPEQAAAVIVKAATLTGDAVNGSFVDDAGTVAW